ncbi:hypothetical protein EDM00_09325 [Ornithobacterium rhinotracheale]|uniref:hypothetical protein n=1 Tax=Ornithobacterium rhinotracheale TaxID=28251 RepID=UPI00129C873F|nr:hypothetical protein [Ornithobacterium rhinotracheale]MRI64187.1 hypothetical protein [Ornithobacterium rhinotracheale]
MKLKEQKKIVHSERPEIEADINDLIIETLNNIQKDGILTKKLRDNIVKLIVRLARELNFCGDSPDDPTLLLDSILCFAGVLEEVEATTSYLKGEEYEPNKNFRDKNE